MTTDAVAMIHDKICHMYCLISPHHMYSHVRRDNSQADPHTRSRMKFLSLNSSDLAVIQLSISIPLDSPARQL